MPASSGIALRTPVPLANRAESLVFLANGENYGSMVAFGRIGGRSDFGESAFEMAARGWREPRRRRRPRAADRMIGQPVARKGRFRAGNDEKS